MTNEEKAREIGKKCSRIAMEVCDSEDECIQSALLMAQWKDEQLEAEKQALIDKACEWLRNNINDYYMTNEFEQWFDEMFDDFKQAMKANELMVNDWVLDTFDKPLRVRDIITFDNKYSAKRYVNGNSLEGGNAYCQREENIKPTPLTAEILEKNGFVGEGDKFKMWTSTDRRVILHNNDEYLNTFNKWHVHVDTEDMRTIGSIELTYVHQLQQFLRLCGMNELADNFKI